MATTSTGSRLRAIALGCLVALGGGAAARAQLQVVATVPDLADLAARIGGEHVVAESLMGGHEDLHMVRIRPSMVVKMRRAQVFLQLGLDAEHAWVPPLLRTARNDAVEPGAPGFCNAAAGIAALQVPRAMTRDQGPDLHPTGNPHYNLDPVRMRIAAGNVRDCLKRVDPAHAAAYDEGLLGWQRELDDKLEQWRQQLAPLRSAAFIEAHNSWVYFADTFGLRIVARLEPKPGLAPTPGHLAAVMATALRERVGLVVGQAQFADVAERVAEHAGGVAVTLPICSASEGPLHGWFAFMDHVVAEFATHLRPAPARPVEATRDGGRDGAPDAGREDTPTAVGAGGSGAGGP